MAHCFAGVLERERQEQLPVLQPGGGRPPAGRLGGALDEARQDSAVLQLLRRTQTDLGVGVVVPAPEEIQQAHRASPGRASRGTAAATARRQLVKKEWAREPAVFQK